MLLILTGNEVLRKGLLLVGFSRKRQKNVKREKNLDRFSSHFGIRFPGVYAVLWEMLQTTDNADIRVDNATEKDFEHFLWALHFLAVYPTENQCEATFDASDRTVRKYVWIFIEKIARLLPEVIFWPDEWDSEFIITVDGVHCLINEPGHGEWSKNPKYYSHKFKKSGLTCEIAISIFHQACVWINGPYRAGRNDTSVFNAGLKGKMEQDAPGKLCIADLGYKGNKHIIANPSSHDIKEVREFKSRALARHESFNGKMKVFEILEKRFRHDLAKHQHCFYAVAVIAQLELENGSPLFDV